MIRLLQISDLHLGSPLGGVPPFPVTERVPGLQGHDPSALGEIELMFEDYRVGEPDGAKLLVTGDITAYGHPDQFDFAKRMLDGYAELGGMAVAGIQTSVSGRPIVAGNHDHLRGNLWPGPQGSTSDAFDDFFPQHPSVASGCIPIDGWDLRLLRLDTTAWASFFEQGRATGSCVAQVRKLDRLLRRLPPEPKEVRALLLHHPLSHLPVGRLRREALNDASKKAIHKLVRDHRIVALLSGHTHWPDLQVRAFGRPGVLEAVCGTTAQRSSPTYAGFPRKAHPPNTAVLHEIEGSHDELVWTARVLERTTDQFLLRQGVARYEARLVIPL